MRPVTDLAAFRRQRELERRGYNRRAARAIAEANLEHQLAASLDRCEACGDLVFQHSPYQLLRCASTPPRRGA